jgi:hypothetical protein
VTESSTNGQFQVDLGGMVELLSKNLYSSGDVYLRELLQNGVDAITAKGLPPEKGRIRFIVAPRRLIMTDNGIGLDKDQARELLSTIGGSSKRDEFGLGRSDFLGQFGIGLLSCFLVSNEITVYAQAENKPAILWRGDSGGTWTVEETTTHPLLEETGTVIELSAMPGEPDFSYEVIAERVRHYGSFLPVPVTVERPGDRSDSEIISTQEPVWARSDYAQHAWCRSNFGFEPMAAIPLDVPVAGLKGVAFVLSQGTHPSRGMHNHLYLRGMLLSKRVVDLVPDWAYFVRVVADTHYLRPTASRDALFEDSLLEETREQVGETIRLWLNDLPQDQFEIFVAVHAMGLKALAVVDPQTRELVKRGLPFETSTGRKTLNELLEEGPIRYFITDQQYQSVLPIAAANDFTVVNACYSYDPAIMDQLRLDYPTHPIAQASVTDVIGVLGVLDPSQEAKFLPLIQRAQESLASQNVRVIIRDFQPPSIPVLFLPAKEADAQWVENSARQAEGESVLMSILDTVSEISNPHLVGDKAQVIFNVQSELVHQLLDASEKDLIDHAIRGLYVQALMSGSHLMDMEARNWASEMFTSLISRLI